MCHHKSPNIVVLMLVSCFLALLPATFYIASHINSSDVTNNLLQRKLISLVACWPLHLTKYFKVYQWTYSFSWDSYVWFLMNTKKQTLIFCSYQRFFGTKNYRLVFTYWHLLVHSWEPAEVSRVSIWTFCQNCWQAQVCCGSVCWITVEVHLDTSHIYLQHATEVLWICQDTSHSN